MGWFVPEGARATKVPTAEKVEPVPELPETLELNVGGGRHGELSLQADELVTGRTAVLGQSGSGKSYLTAVLCEELAAKGVPFVVVDPEGEYASLKEKFEVLHVAAEGGDVPLDSISYPKLAQAVLRGGVPVVFDVSEGNTQKAGPFLEALFDATDPGQTRPCLVILEEASLFAPQTGERTPSVIELARRGRKRGLGLLVATQRPAMVDKNVLSQCNSFFAGKLALPHDLKALRQMVPASVLQQVPKLEKGEFLLVGALAGEKGMLRFKARQRLTTHRAATPKTRRSPPTKALTEVIQSVLAKDGRGAIAEAEPVDDEKEAPKPKAAAAVVRRKPEAEEGKRVLQHLVARYDLETAKHLVERKRLQRKYWLFGPRTERITRTRQRWVQLHVITLGFEEGLVTKRLAHRFALVAPQRNVFVLRDLKGTWNYETYSGLARGHLLALETLGKGKWYRVPWSRPRLATDQVASSAGLSRSYVLRVLRDLVGWRLAEYDAATSTYRMARRLPLPKRRKLLTITRPELVRDEVEGRLEPSEETIPAEVMQLLGGVRGSVLEDRLAWLPLYEFTIADKRNRERSVTFDPVTGRIWKTRFL